MKKIYPLIIGIIIAAGAFVRFWGLDKSPPSLGFDEAALGYNAYSILETGRDEYGNFLPISIRSFNDYKPSLYVYLTVPFIKIFGVTDAAVRMTSAMAGVISLIFLYLLLTVFIKDRTARLWLFLWLSFEPWRLHYSRSAFETHLSMACFVAGAYWLLKKDKWWKILAAFSLAAYSYHSARLSVPLLILMSAADPLKQIFEKRFWPGIAGNLLKNRKMILLLGGFLAVTVPIFIANNSQQILTRFRQENVFSHFYYSQKELQNKINPYLSLRNNPLYYDAGVIVGHIMAYFSPVNLNQRIYSWVRGSPQFIPGMSMLGWIEGIAVIAGIFIIMKQLKKTRESRILIYWIIAGIAPAAATWTWFHPLRSLNIYPALEILAALGTIEIFKILGKFKYVLTFVLAVTTVFTINNELIYSAFENLGEYQPGGFREGMPYLKSIQDKYQKVVIDSPHAQNYIQLAFYQAMDPRIIQKYANIRPKPGIEGNLNFNFDKYEFRKFDWTKDKYLKNTVFWTSSEVIPEEIAAVPGARIRKIISNVRYKTAVIITTE